MIGPLLPSLMVAVVQASARDRRNQIVHPNRAVGCIAQMQTDRVTTTPFPLGKIHFRTRLPDQGRTLDFGEIPLVQRSYPIPKSRRIAVQFIGSHPLKGQTTALNGTLQQFQPNFRLRFGCQIVRNAASLALIPVRFVKPAFRHEQLPFDQAVAFPTGIAQIDPDLTVGNLSHRSAVLRGYSHRVVSLFDHPQIRRSEPPHRLLPTSPPPSVDGSQSPVLSSTGFDRQSIAGCARFHPVPAPFAQHSCALHLPASRAGRLCFAPTVPLAERQVQTSRYNPSSHPKTVRYLARSNCIPERDKFQLQFP